MFGLKFIHTLFFRFVLTQNTDKKFSKQLFSMALFLL
jgi:hypothetical protein